MKTILMIGALAMGIVIVAIVASKQEPARAAAVAVDVVAQAPTAAAEMSRLVAAHEEAIQNLTAQIDGLTSQIGTLTKQLTTTSKSTLAVTALETKLKKLGDYVDKLEKSIVQIDMADSNKESVEKRAEHLKSMSRP